MDADILLRLLVVFVPMLLSLTVHEASHALSAWYLGDDTARRQGRLSLNPLVHVDLFGTVILPLMLVLSNTGFFFGWAKPVPVNPVNFKRGITMRTGMMITAAAGPASNILLAVFSVGLMKSGMMVGLVSEPVLMLLYQMLSINLILALFNLIPFPPLDGSKVLQGLLPHRFSNIYSIFEQNPWLSLVGFFVIIKFAWVLIGPAYQAMLSGLLHLFEIHV